MLVINAYRPRINRILRKNKRRFLSRAEIYFNILININGRTNSWLMVNPIAVDLDHNLNNISSSSLIVILSFFFPFLLNLALNCCLTATIRFGKVEGSERPS